MYDKRILLPLLLLIIHTSCVSVGEKKPEKVYRNGMDMLYGKIDRQTLFAEYPDWQDIYNAYQPDSAVLSRLGEIDGELKIYIFLGTWCGDSRREVPRFLKIVNSISHIAEQDLIIWAVDRSKEVESDLVKDFKIERVATFIFLINGNEVGRIVERPTYEKLEKDMIEILESTI